VSDENVEVAPIARREISWPAWIALLGVSPIVYATVRLISFSGGDRVVLVTLVRSLNIQGILIGSLAPLALSVLVSLLYLYLIAPIFRSSINAQLKRTPLLGVVAGLVVLLVLFRMPLSTLFEQFGVYDRGHPAELRHTCASLAVLVGANVKALQKMLGHASAAITLDVYADLFDEDLDDVATALNERVAMLADYSGEKS
jgi:hypothetical protein